MDQIILVQLALGILAYQRQRLLDKNIQEVLFIGLVGIIVQLIVMVEAEQGMPMEMHTRIQIAPVFQIRVEMGKDGHVITIHTSGIMDHVIVHKQR